VSIGDSDWLQDVPFPLFAKIAVLVDRFPNIKNE
jgi:hypothetical protein